MSCPGGFEGAVDSLEVLYIAPGTGCARRYSRAPAVFSDCLLRGEERDAASKERASPALILRVAGMDVE
jgi:hypothetical protein